MRTKTRPGPLNVAMRSVALVHAEHGVLRVQHQVEDDLLQLAVVAVNARKLRIEVGLDANLRGLELMFQQSERVAQQFVEIDARELRAAGAREVEQAIDDLRGAEGLLRDLFEHRGEPLIVAHVLGQHLRVAGDDGQRRVDLVRDAGGQQADGGELLRLRQAAPPTGCGR